MITAKAVKAQAVAVFTAQLQAAWEAGRDGRDLDLSAALAAIGAPVNAWIMLSMAKRLRKLAAEKEAAAETWLNAAGLDRAGTQVAP